MIASILSNGLLNYQLLATAVRRKSNELSKIVGDL